jgi:enoyl-[acyl-carrier protein] reductase I
MGVFDGKKGLILGVANDHSIAWAIAQRIMIEGGLCGFTHLPDRADDERQRNRRRVALLTDPEPRAKFLVPMDAGKDDDIQGVAARAAQEFGKLDFVLHSIAFASTDDLKRPTVETSRDGFKMAMEISAYSLIAVANAVKDVMSPSAAILTLTYYGGERVVPGYNVMGICKAALDCSMKYLAYDLGPRGIRVNALSAGPLRTLAARAVGSDDMHTLYEQIAPSGKNISHEDVARSGAFLLSEMSEGITGEILHVDGGYNIMGSPGRMLEKLKSAQPAG